MCDICRHERCLDPCPNNISFTEPPFYCVICGRPIYRGETAYALEEGVLCEDCMQESAFVVTDYGE